MLPEEPKIESITVTLPGGPRAATQARAAVSGLRTDLDPPTIENARLLVTELVTNTVRHASGGEVHLTVLVADTNVRVEVANRGAPFEPRPRQEGVERESGWGLLLVDRLTHRWGVEQRGELICVWFELLRA